MSYGNQINFERDALERIGELEDKVEKLSNLVFVLQKSIHSLQNHVTTISEK